MRIVLLLVLLVASCQTTLAQHPFIKPDLEAKQLKPLPLMGFDNPEVLRLTPLVVEKPHFGDKFFWIGVGAFSAASIADIVTTNGALSRGAVERNPLFATNNGHSYRTGWNAAASVGIIAFAAWCEHRGYKRFARVLLFTGAAIRTGAAINNYGRGR